MSKLFYAFLAFVLSTPSFGNDFPSITERLIFDKNVTSGTSDSLGDRKEVEFTFRKSGMVYSAYTGLITTQKNKDNEQFDNSRFTVGVGKEYEKLGIYGSFGYQNGKSLELSHRMVDSMHEKMGWGDARKSESSKEEKFLFGVAGRYDHTIQTGSECSLVCSSLVSTPFFVANNSEIELGFSAFFNIYLNGSEVSHPDLKGLPAKKSEGTYLRFGLIETFTVATFDDHNDEARSFNTEAVAAIGYQKDSWGMSLGLHVPLLSTVKGVSDRPIPYLSAKLSKTL